MNRSKIKSSVQMFSTFVPCGNQADHTYTCFHQAIKLKQELYYLSPEANFRDALFLRRLLSSEGVKSVNK